jgi:hypothetical protein
MRRGLALELALFTLAAAAAAASVPLLTGQMLWSWDALNHHIYLGMIAERPRWDLDVIPANFQSYQYPYLYWPVYRMSLWDGSGAVAGAAWSAFEAAMLVPPTWVIAWRLAGEGESWSDRVARIAACLLAFTSVIVLTGLETTGNDALASVPLLWALALGMTRPDSDRMAFACAALWGVSTAFKFSNGIFIPLLLLWWWTPRRPRWQLRRAGALAVGAVLGFVLVYLPWGWQLWRQTGNPFYPYFGGLFPAS